MTLSTEKITDKPGSTSGHGRMAVSPILMRYILKEFLKLFSLTLSALLCLSILVEFFEKIDNFIEHHAGLWPIVEYFIFYTPRVIFYGAPMAVLLATLLTLGVLSRNSEIVAMRAAGISLYSIAIPMLSVAFLISIISFVFNETLVFSANQRMNYIMDVKIKKKTQKAFFKQNKVWIRGQDNTIINIDLLHPDGENLYGVTVYKFADGFNLLERVDAEEVRWDGARWIFIHGKIRSFFPNGRISEKDFDAIYHELYENVEHLKEAEKQSEEMNIVELYNYIQRLKTAGFNAIRHVVDMHSKVSFAFVSFVMALFGVPFSFKGGKSEGIIIGIGTSILIAFLYWVIFFMGISLGRAGIFPPFFAAWVGNLIFGAAGFYMLLSVRQ